MMKMVDDFRWNLRQKEYVPIMTGGMGVDISTAALALEAVRLGGIGHISDAMGPTVSDRRYETNFVQQKYQKYKANTSSTDKSQVHFDLKIVEEATFLHVNNTMNSKRGDGMIFVNCMEKLTMNNPRETLQARMVGAMNAGVDGITLSAGLHLGTMSLISEHPRFRDTYLGIIISSVRALRPFLKRAAKLDRMPDYIVVEGPLAGGHLGFGMDWAKYDLKTVFIEIVEFLKANDLDIPVVPAGGIFTGSDAVEYMDLGAAAVQVATRFTVSDECGLPNQAKQKYFEAIEKDVVVNQISPTGYPMRMLTNSPGIGQGIRPNCEAFGYILDKDGHCAYVDAYHRELDRTQREGGKLIVQDKTCLCTQMRNFKIWTCGHYVYRLKDTTHQLEDGNYQMLTAEHIFKDYQYSRDHQVKLPAVAPIPPEKKKFVEEAVA
jgi:nitronate monooxygenase